MSEKYLSTEALIERLYSSGTIDAEERKRLLAGLPRKQSRADDDHVHEVGGCRNCPYDRPKQSGGGN